MVEFAPKVIGRTPDGLYRVNVGRTDGQNLGAAGMVVPMTESEFEQAKAAFAARQANKGDAFVKNSTSTVYDNLNSMPVMDIIPKIPLENGRSLRFYDPTGGMLNLTDIAASNT